MLISQCHFDGPPSEARGLSTGPPETNGRMMGPPEAHGPPKVHRPRGHCPPCPPLGGPGYTNEE